MTLSAYSYPGLSKNAFIAELTLHAEQDRIVKGTYGEDAQPTVFRGCAVGCAIHSIGNVLGVSSLRYSDHALIEAYLGIPLVLARLQDTIFEGLPAELALAWPVRFGSAIRTGADLSGVWNLFAPWMLREIALPSVTDERVRGAIIAVADGYETDWATISPAAAADAAYAAARTAYAADAAAARAAYAAARTAYAADAADGAAYAADAAARADAAYAAARADAAYAVMADRLIALMEAV